MRRGTYTKVARSISATPTKYAHISSMVKDLDVMAETLRIWAIQEHDAMAEGRANFDYSKYYARLADVLEGASGVARKIVHTVE